jgi:hypothetical protein
MTMFKRPLLRALLAGTALAATLATSLAHAQTKEQGHAM